MLSGNPPVFSSVQGGLHFLNEISLTNAQVAEQKLQQFIDAVLASPLEINDVLELLEASRRIFNQVITEQNRHYLNKPLPLSPEEEAVWGGVIKLWYRLIQGYRHGLDRFPKNSIAPQQALLVGTIYHRCIYLTGMVIFEHYRIRRELPEGIWRDLHAYFSAAENRGLAQTPVKDINRNEGPLTHCTAAYVGILLIEIAGPYSQSLQNLNSIRQLAGLWSAQVTVHALDDEHYQIPPYLIELMVDAPLHQAGPDADPGSDARALDTIRLAMQIAQVQKQLQQRVSPADLGLDGFSAGTLAQLLGRLSRPWAQLSSPRKFRRFACKGTANVVAGFELMYFHVKGNPFVQPEGTEAFTRDDFDKLFTFRDCVTAVQPPMAPDVAKFPSEIWDVVNHSASGFRLFRESGEERLAHAQLLAVLPHDGERFVLCRISWLMQVHQGGLVCGVHLLPGLPEALAIRGFGTDERFSPGFFLPAISAIQEPASLVVASGTFLSRRLMDVQIGREKWKIRLLNVIDRGSDYERISYELA